jgi:hypothetical protein
MNPASKALIKKKLNNLSYRNRLWEIKFLELNEFKKKNGHCNVPPHVSKYATLYTWCIEQRRNNNAGAMLPERESRLTKTGFSWKPNDDLFEQKYIILKKYYKKHGHCRVTRLQNPALREWCVRLRGIKRGTIKNKSLTPERIKKLNALKFDWNESNEIQKMKSDKQWEQKFLELKAYKKKHGTVKVKFAINPYLYAWTLKQRKNCKTKSKLLTKERIKLLTSIGFPWVYKYVPGEHLKIKDSDLLNDLKRLYSIRKKLPGKNDIKKYGKYSANTYRNHFGKMSKAYKLAGLTSLRPGLST